MGEASDDIAIDNNKFGIIDIKETEKKILYASSAQ